MFKKVFILLSLTSCFLIYGQTLSDPELEEWLREAEEMDRITEELINSTDELLETMSSDAFVEAFENANTDTERLRAFNILVGNYPFEMYTEVFGSEVFISLIEQAQLQDLEALYKLGRLSEYEEATLDDLQSVVFLYEKAREVVRRSGTSSEQMDDLYIDLTTRIVELNAEIEAYRNR